MRKAYKSIISLAVVLIAGLKFIVPAFAQDPFTGIAIGGIGGASGAGLFGSMASMSGIDIGWSNTGSDPMDALWNNLNPESVYFSGEKHEANPQAYPEDIYDYIIVDLRDWLEAQSDFIVNFAQNYNVQDDDSGTITTPQSLYGIPKSNSGYYELEFNGAGTYVLGGFTLSIVESSPGVFTCSGTCVNGTSVAVNRAWSTAQFGGFPAKCGIEVNSAATQWAVRIQFSPTDWRNWSGGSGYVSLPVVSGQNIAWESNSVNLNVYSGWERAKVKIPHSISGLSHNWTIPDFTNALNNLWENNQQGQIVIEDTDTPVPPPVPVPSTPLGDVPFDDWVDLWGQGIYQQLENQSDALDFIGSNGEDQIEELESIDSNLHDLNQTTESIDTNIGIGIGLLGGIKSGIETAVDFLEGIAEHVGELVEEIVEGTETLIAGILNQIPSVFGVIFGPIKQASSIWHYVVEWIQSILAPMSWIWSMASGTSYNIILPVYASLAGAVVLAFYKRFGK